MDKVLDRLKVLMDSSTPIVVMETVEETRAVRMARAACSALNLAAFEWTIASGLARCGVSTVATIEQGAFLREAIAPARSTTLLKAPRRFTTAGILEKCSPISRASALKRLSF